MAKQAHDIICGLDVGTSAVRVVVGQRAPKTGQFQVVGAAEGPSDGVSKGLIVSIDDTVTSISTVLEKVERLTGQAITHAFVGISGSHIVSEISRGVVAVSSASGEIKPEDVERVIDAAQTLSTPPNYEILHVIPRCFTVDSQRSIKDPIGMTGIRLEVETQIIEGATAQIKNLNKCVSRAGIEIDDLVFSVLGDAEAILTKRQKELGVALVNLGAATTSYVIFEEGDIVGAGVLPIGARHITNDLAIGLRVSLDLAEELKLAYGTAVPAAVGKKEVINLNEFSATEQEVISRKEMADIINARVEEIFHLIDQEFAKLERSGKLPGGVVFTGGGAKLPGLVEVAKKEFKLPAAIGAPKDLVTAVDKVNDTTFATALGLALWGGQSMPINSQNVTLNKGLGQVKKMFKWLMP